jgi:hypothetical protein
LHEQPFTIYVLYLLSLVYSFPSVPIAATEMEVRTYLGKCGHGGKQCQCDFEQFGIEAT